MTISPRQFDPEPYFPGLQSPKKRAKEIQGKLFRDPNPPSEDVRWAGAKGYSPERMAEVRATVQVANVRAGEDRETYRVHPFGTARDPYSPGKGGSLQRSSRLGEMRGYEALARSTMPSEDLASIRRRIERPMLIQTGSFNGFSAFDSGGGGTFHSPRGERRDPMIKLNAGAPSDADATGTLLHEMGHAHSWATGRDSSQYVTPRQQGADEAYADDYRVQHAVPRRKERSSPDASRQSSYEERSTWNNRLGIIDGMVAHDTYRTERQVDNPRERERAEHDAAMREGIPTYVSSNQHVLFGRPVDRSVTSAPGYEDRGQHGYASWQTEEFTSGSGRTYHRNRRLDTLPVKGDL